MKLFHALNHLPRPADPRNFTGKATMVRMDGVNESPDINVYRVTFQPCARTAWHTHTGPQLLLVIEGSCRLQKEGGPIQELRAGGAARVEPGERHWHGATPDAPMVHLAMNIDAATTWSEQVTDEQYAGPAS
jgi:quercetin dioxygenase-like cupin family protein